MLGLPSDPDVAKNLEDGIAKMSRSRFDASRPLSVKFADELGSSEGAVDLGGPTREFLRLAVQEAFSTNAFIGTASSKVIVIKWVVNKTLQHILRFCSSAKILPLFFVFVGDATRV